MKHSKIGQSGAHSATPKLDCGCINIVGMGSYVGCQSCGYLCCFNCDHIDCTPVDIDDWKCYEGHGCDKGDAQ
jgi:hypothetical protein